MYFSYWVWVSWLGLILVFASATAPCLGQFCLAILFLVELRDAGWSQALKIWKEPFRINLKTGTEVPWFYVHGVIDSNLAQVMSAYCGSGKTCSAQCQLNFLQYSSRKLETGAETTPVWCEPCCVAAQAGSLCVYVCMLGQEQLLSVNTRTLASTP